MATVPRADINVQVFNARSSRSGSGSSRTSGASTSREVPIQIHYSRVGSNLFFTYCYAVVVVKNNSWVTEVQETIQFYLIDCFYNLIQEWYSTMLLYLFKIIVLAIHNFDSNSSVRFSKIFRLKLLATKLLQIEILQAIFISIFLKRFGGKDGQFRFSCLLRPSCFLFFCNECFSACVFKDICVKVYFVGGKTSPLLSYPVSEIQNKLSCRCTLSQLATPPNLEIAYHPYFEAFCKL